MSTIDVFAALAAHTQSACGACRVPYRCCTRAQCEATARGALEDFGTDLTALRTDHPELPFLGPQGCVVAPHMRPICTVHVCDQHLSDNAWSDRYWELRDDAGLALESMLEAGRFPAADELAQEALDPLAIGHIS